MAYAAAVFSWSKEFRDEAFAELPCRRPAVAGAGLRRRGADRDLAAAPRHRRAAGRGRRAADEPCALERAGARLRARAQTDPRFLQAAADGEEQRHPGVGARLDPATRKSVV